MTAQKSDQVTKLEASPLQRLNTDELGGRVRVARFSFTVPAGNAAIADTIDLIKIPAGARILGGHAAWEAMSTGGAAATLELGDGTTAAKYLEATSVDAAGSADFADTVARNYGEKLTAELTLTGTVSVEAWLAGQQFVGHVLYVMD